MKGLSLNWLSEPAIDREYKRYLALGYLKRLDDKLSEGALYPYLYNLSEHVKNLRLFGKSLEEHRSNWPKKIEDARLNPPRLVFNKPTLDGALMDIVWETYRFALPRFVKQLEKADRIKADFLPQIELEPVGLEPLSRNEGYLMVRTQRILRVYQYRIRRISEPREEKSHRNVVTHYLEERWLALHSTAGTVKYELIRRNPDIPNPAVYQVICDKPMPLMQTLLPLSKAKLLECSKDDPGLRG